MASHLAQPRKVATRRSNKPNWDKLPAKEERVDLKKGADGRHTSTAKQRSMAFWGRVQAIYLASCCLCELGRSNDRAKKR